MGVGLGSALVGCRPVIEIQYSDFLTECMDQIVNQAAKVRYMSGGQLKAPMVVRTPGGRSRSSAAQHSQSLESWFVNIPGLLVVGPSNIAIATEDPVLFFEHKLLYGLRQPALHEEKVVPLGKAAVYREGSDVTVVAWSWMVQEALKAAARVEAELGASVEVVDLRSLVPLDIDTVIASVEKTGRLVVAHEAPVQGGWGGDVVATVLDRAWSRLASAPIRVGATAVPVPMASNLESVVLPDALDVVAAVAQVLELRSSR
jgi:pyruvate dehydrogenase E1 component beta subunit